VRSWYRRCRPCCRSRRRRSSNGRKKQVFAVNGKNIKSGAIAVAKLKPIEIGETNWTFTQVTKGLGEGEFVITTPEAEGLKDGAKWRLSKLKCGVRNRKTPDPEPYQHHDHPFPHQQNYRMGRSTSARCAMLPSPCRRASLSPSWGRRVRQINADEHDRMS